MKPDYVNGTLELLGSVALWLNVRALYRAKQVRGVHWGGAAFFTCWGCWNLYYYPTLGQWASFAGGISIAAANCTWLCMAVYYGRLAMKQQDRIKYDDKRGKWLVLFGGRVIKAKWNSSKEAYAHLLDLQNKVAQPEYEA